MHWWRRQRKIAQHPSAERTPLIVVAQTLDKVQQDQIAGLVVCIKWKDGTFSTDASDNQRLSDLLLHQHFLGQVADKL